MQRAATRNRRCGSCRHVSNYCGNDYYCGTYHNGSASNYCRTHHNDSITDDFDCCDSYDGTADFDCCDNYDHRCANDNHDRKHQLDPRTACPPRGQ